MATIKDVAAAAKVSTATVSAVVNDSAYVSPGLRARVLQAVRELGYAPSQLARNLRRGRSELIAIAVADLSNPFYARVVCAAEAAVAAWGYSLVVFNSDEKPEAEKRILGRVRMLHCEGLVLVPVGEASHAGRRDPEGGRLPTVLFGRVIDDDRLDAVTIDNFSASYQATSYLIDLGHTRIGAITGPMHLSTGKQRLEGMEAALRAKNIALDSRFVRQGEFREEAAYSAARGLLTQAERPTALYVASGLMALGVMRAIADVGLRCPEDVSVASTDNIPGVRGLRPSLTRTEHPIVEMVNEAVRLLVDRIKANHRGEGRTVVFQPSLVVGDSCVSLNRPPR
ncbi:MAG TPA: LacI family DNA-binding transcriptional regulator [Roseiarcus sp.]|nr:LacI family DNA-binding transcriptional regulator [Roseiarcus sp.]